MFPFMFLKIISHFKEIVCMIMLNPIVTSANPRATVAMVTKAKDIKKAICSYFERKL